MVEDNEYAISVPVEVNTAGGSISRLVAGFPGPARRWSATARTCVESYAALAAGGGARPRAGKGPALVHAHVIRPYSHSLSDDERFYKTAAMREAEALARPARRARRRCCSEEYGVSQRGAGGASSQEVQARR